MNPIKQLLQYKYDYTFTVKNHPSGVFARIFDFARFITSYKIAPLRKGTHPAIEYAFQFSDMAKWVGINIKNNYIYPLDEKVVRSKNKSFRKIASVTPDYSTILTSSINAKRLEVDSLQTGDFKQSLNICLDAIGIYIGRIVNYLTAISNPRSKELLTYFSNMKDKESTSFDESIQRILFYNALFWQCGHMQNGIGRLDLILEPYFTKDIKAGILTREKAKVMLRDMINILGSNLHYKSAGLIGDTGQVIIIGGVDANGNTVENDLTHIFLELFTENPTPDPKLILRVNKDTSDRVWKNAIETILKGSGSPLIMNDDVIIPKMVSFGYNKNDVWNVGTSACWEPLIIGKSFDQNNCTPNIPIIESLLAVINQYPNTTYDELLTNLNKELNKQIEGHCLKVCFEYSPLLSLYFDDCIKKNKDFTKGGATYNYHGILVSGLPNLVNAILNLKQYVYDQHLITMEECIDMLKTNYSGREDIRQLFNNGERKFGSTDVETIALTNYLIEIIGKAVEKREMFGQKIKVGFSSPGYITVARRVCATPDGRKNGDPFAVHISPISSKIDISEILDFASQMKYEGACINGNIVDFIIPSAYVKQPEKLKTYIRNGCEKGLYELQLNVLDKATLIDAKAHPENYPNLIVRVWGFSAYFNDLPEEYKDNLIARAEIYEA